MKFFRYLIAFFIIFLLFLILFELFAYVKNSVHTGESAPYNLFRKDFSIENIENNKETHFRKPAGLQYSKPPVVIYGCSYAYGYHLKENQNIGILLSDLSKRPVYNYSFPSTGLQHALYLIKYTKPVQPAPDYIFYFYIQDQIRRLYVTASELSPYYYFDYKYQNGEMTKNNGVFNLLKNLMLYYYIFDKFIFHKLNQEDNFNKLKLYLSAMKNELTAKYPEAKFVFVIYDKKFDLAIKFTDEKIQEIKNMGIDVIDLDKIFGDKLYDKEYRLDDYVHPNEKAWELIAPELVKIENM